MENLIPIDGTKSILSSSLIRCLIPINLSYWRWGNFIAPIAPFCGDKKKPPITPQIKGCCISPNSVGPTTSVIFLFPHGRPSSDRLPSAMETRDTALLAVDVVSAEGSSSGHRGSGRRLSSLYAAALILFATLLLAVAVVGRVAVAMRPRRGCWRWPCRRRHTSWVRRLVSSSPAC